MIRGDGDHDLLPRFVPRDLPDGPRRVYLAATVFFLAVFAALVWPLYASVATIRPFVLGMPFSLAHVVIVLLAAFGVLLALYVWEGRRDLHDPLDPTALEEERGPGEGHGAGADPTLDDGGEPFRAPGHG